MTRVVDRAPDSATDVAGAGAEEPEPSRLEVSVLITAPAWRDAVAGAAGLARTAAHRALRRTDFEGPVEVTVLLADDREVRRLNRDHRGRDAATNVLAFPGEPGATPGEAGPRLLGDVVLAFETCAREARDQGKSLAHHLCHLTVHGVLHLAGHDHETEAEARRMETLERRILAGLGIADPYHPVAPGP